MQTNRRAFLGIAAAAGLVGLRPSILSAQPGDSKPAATLPPPITRAERMQRIAKAQQLMRAAGLKALLVESGSSLVYFTGVQWRRSERLTAALIPAEGETVVVTPEFEEPSVRESLTVPAEVRVWNEHSSPFALLADWLKAHGAGKGPVGVEETTRFFAFAGLRALGIETRDDAGVVRTCRVIKSPAEIALLQAASDITVAAYRETGPQIARGMKPADISQIMSAAMAKRGGTPEFTLVLLGEASAYPHGSHKPQEVRPGEVVLMDCGCSYEGYQSDISRTMVMGEATKQQRDVWDLVKRGQQIAFETAKVGTPAGAVDDAVRAVYVKAGYGPGYKLPGTSHRTGHGIGLDVHEPVYLVHEGVTHLAPGMCFSDEPGIYIPGSFGVRLEDCIHMTESGPKWFSVPPTSIDAPFGS
ncbi:MAG TPA: Xaa-Pro peptidase family protein [Steroidobacteraceae bacterium]|jgi:Xaa-Pro aminopeptidase|nr:Xaa-Pro peptidase family protein [Steroidobacteraceae bacterium]